MCVVFAGELEALMPSFLADRKCEVGQVKLRVDVCCSVEEGRCWRDDIVGEIANVRRPVSGGVKSLSMRSNMGVLVVPWLMCVVDGGGNVLVVDCCLMSKALWSV